MLGKALDGYPMALPAGVIASASVLLVGTYFHKHFLISCLLRSNTLHSYYTSSLLFIFFPFHTNYSSSAISYFSSFPLLPISFYSSPPFLLPFFSAPYTPDLHDYTKEARAKTQKMVKDKVLDPSMLPWMAHTYGYEPP